MFSLGVSSHFPFVCFSQHVTTGKSSTCLRKPKDNQKNLDQHAKYMNSKEKNERQHRKPNEIKKTSVATVQVFPRHSLQHLVFNNGEDFRHEDEQYQDRYNEQELGV